ncbi:MAG: cysteine desulfurase family protein [Balneolaceae bacterium]
MRTVYLDYAATTPLDERVLEAMLPFLKENYGNANSIHHLGQQAKIVVEDARESIAAAINAKPSEIIFTSGGTESDNAAIKGVLAASGAKNEIITSEIEHHAILHPVQMSKMGGFKTLFAEPNEKGIITASAIEKLITDKTAIVTIMHVNNEIGTVNDIKEIAKLCNEHKIPFHTDAVQSLGKMPLDVKELDINLLSGSAHKIYGPKGIGLLYVKNGTPWIPWLTGGSQERRRRGGTLNVPGIVGFAKAVEFAIADIEKNNTHFKKLRNVLLSTMSDTISIKYCINGDSEHGVPHILNLSFFDSDNNCIDGEMLLRNLDIEGICVSNGSACTSGAIEPSHVLSGIGVKDDVANSSIRVSFGKDTTEEEVLYFVNKLDQITKRMFALT